jgi:hypothetical protein
MTFTVTFRPNKSNYYFFQHLEFFAFKYSAKLTKKILQEAGGHQLPGDGINTTRVGNLTHSQMHTTGSGAPVSADETIPPYYSSIRCVGHSFGDGSQPYIPNLKAHPSEHVYFAACSREESLYQTIELHNLSDTPTYFRFNPDPSRTFRVYPIAGVVEGKGFCILIVEFAPKDFRAYEQTLHCHLNHSASNSLKLHVSGYCSEPSLSLQNSGKVYFPPSYTG